MNKVWKSENVNIFVFKNYVNELIAMNKASMMDVLNILT
jgi:hypothetical protein